VARGLAAGDVQFVNGQIVNVFTRRIEPGNIVCADGFIAGFGPFEWQAERTIDLEGRFVLPGLVDAHMHLESALLSPSELARLVVPQGTSAIVCDPHEIGNVLGVRGIEMLLKASERLPLELFFMAPSCVPAAAWENSGAVLGVAEVGELLKHERVQGLAEVMDFPALLGGDSNVLRKVLAATDAMAAVDGHAPGLSGRDLVAYVSAGIRSDHESTTAAEARHKASLGMLVQVREGSSARNLATLLPLIVADELGDWCLATDDIHADDLIERGHINSLLLRVIAAGVSPASAVRHATLVPAKHYGLSDRGAIAPGYRADLVVMDNWQQRDPWLVLHRGEVVARQGAYVASTQPPAIPRENTIRIAPLTENDFVLRPSGSSVAAIGISDGQIVTHRRTVDVALGEGRWSFDPQRDVMLVASIERHRASGQRGLGLVSGFGFKSHGAIGSSVAHDSHNLVIAGTNPADMLACSTAIAELGGGWVVVTAGKVIAQLPLPIAGLLSTETAETVARHLSELRQAVRQFGCPLSDPFGILSFLALSVIPELRITDRGLFDVMGQQFIQA
jgi:adenine deaminase